MMFLCLIGALFVVVVGVTIWLDPKSPKEIGQFFTGGGALAAVILGVMMMRGAQ